MTTTTTNQGLPLLPAYRDVSIEQVKRGRGRWYKVGDQMLPPVTSILDIIDKSGPLVPWATKVAFEAVESVALHGAYRERWDGYAAFGQSHDYDDYEAWVRTALSLAKDRAKDVREEGAKKGKEAHELIAKMLQGGDPLVPDSLAPAVRGAREFVADYGLSVVAIEVPVWHPTEQYAGTVDFVGRNGDGHLVVADWKRSSGIYPEHGYQITAYAEAIEAITGEPVSHLYVVRLPKEGGEEAGYEYREVIRRNMARRTFRAAHELWSAHRNTKEMW